MNVLIQLILIASISMGFFQNPAVSTYKRVKIRERKMRKIQARIQINDLHQGALLIRLNKRQVTIDALERAGRKEQAGQVEQSQEKLNKEIVEAFKKQFDFCTTYFFYADQSKSVRIGNLKNVVFLNDSLRPDSSIHFEGDCFFTAEFGIIEQDTARYFEGYSTVATEDGVVQRKRYYGGPNLRFGALLIKSDQLIQLRDPFPYYVRTLESVPARKEVKTVVTEMNEKLHKFYTRQ